MFQLLCNRWISESVRASESSSAARRLILGVFGVICAMALSPRLANAGGMNPPTTPPAGTTAHCWVRYEDTSTTPHTVITNYMAWDNSNQMWDGGSTSLQLDSSGSTASVMGGPPWAQIWGGASQWDFIIGGYSQGFYGNSMPDNSGNLTQIPDPTYTDVWTDLYPGTAICEFAPVVINGTILPFATNLGSSYPYTLTLDDGQFY